MRPPTHELAQAWRHCVFMINVDLTHSITAHQHIAAHQPSGQPRTHDWYDKNYKQVVIGNGAQDIGVTRGR